MKSLEHQIVDYIAHRLLAGRHDIHGRELVALVGTGREADNLAATCAWIVARTEEDTSLAPNAVGWLRELFDDYLEDQWALLHQCRAPQMENVDCLPRIPLTDIECQRLAETIAYLVAGPLYRDKLEAAAGLVLGKPACGESALYHWVRAQDDRYAFYPSELTLSLAQRLQRALLALEEV
ncbi:hypothetical protein [Litorivivens sp.]|jgi:hypothetical protein|uniref:hypothetical protein n=1 Tax=Litorivivens sp. TaxID=2020868 RepID=UPI00356197A5